MAKRFLIPGLGSAGLAGLMFAMAAAPAFAGEGADYKKLKAEKSPALVTVKFMLKMSMFGQEQEMENETTGVMIDPGGVVICANSGMAGMMGMMRKMMGADADMTLNPTDIKVLVGDDAEGIEAEMIAKDTDLDLAWIKITDPGDKKFPAIDFKDAAIPEIGDPMYWVRPMDKYFNRAIVIEEGRLGAIVAKPRDLYMPSGYYRATYGIPVFAASGKVIGITILQMPETDASMGNAMSMMSAMGGMQDSATGMVLPAASVVKATERALAVENEE